MSFTNGNPSLNELDFNELCKDLSDTFYGVSLDDETKKQQMTTLHDELLFRIHNTFI